MSEPAPARPNSNPAPTGYPITPLLRDRQSICVFDPDRTVPEGELLSVFEAARWAMSCFNEQPWRYHVGIRARDEARWSAILDCLVEGNRGWAATAPVLAIGCAAGTFERNGERNDWAAHDLGAASALLSVEATARGLFAHQMAGFSKDDARRVLSLPDGLEPMSAIAIGYPGKPEAADPAHRERDEAERRRRPLASIVFGLPGLEGS